MLQKIIITAAITGGIHTPKYVTLFARYSPADYWGCCASPPGWSSCGTYDYTRAA